jgi:hypothetical protein
LAHHYPPAQQLQVTLLPGTPSTGVDFLFHYDGFAQRQFPLNYSPPTCLSGQRQFVILNLAFLTFFATPAK